MASYRFELGIDWNAILKPNTQAFLQTGFADVTKQTVASPINLKAGDTVDFVIFDTTSDGSQTGSLKMCFVKELPASTASSDGLPLSVDKAFEPSSQGLQPSIVFGGSYPMWKTGIGEEIAQDASGRFRLTITVSADNTDKTAEMTWCDDPEVVVGDGQNV